MESSNKLLPLLQEKRLETDRVKGDLVKSFLWPREVCHNTVG